MLRQWEQQTMKRATLSRIKRTNFSRLQHRKSCYLGYLGIGLSGHNCPHTHLITIRKTSKQELLRVEGDTEVCDHWDLAYVTSDLYTYTHT